MKRLERYELKEELGRGAMGIVYRAYDRRLKRDVALKTLNFLHHEFEQRKEEFILRFQREATAVSSLEHPNIVRIYDYDVVDETPFILMEYIRGVPLNRFIENRENYDEAFALHVIRGLAEGLAFAHENGIVHRDVKPQNVLINEEGTAKLVDFGVARFNTETMTTAGVFLGTLAYAAPEQLTSGMATPGTDLFSLAVLACELITGTRPFPSDNHAELMYQIVNAPAVPKVTHLKDFDPDKLSAVLKRALNKRPDSRYESPRAFAQALEDCFTADLLERSFSHNPLEHGHTQDMLAETIALYEQHFHKPLPPEKFWERPWPRIAILSALIFAVLFAVVSPFLPERTPSATPTVPIPLVENSSDETGGTPNDVIKGRDERPPNWADINTKLNQEDEQLPGFTLNAPLTVPVIEPEEKQKKIDPEKEEKDGIKAYPYPLTIRASKDVITENNLSFPNDLQVKARVDLSPGGKVTAIDFSPPMENRILKSMMENAVRQAGLEPDILEGKAVETKLEVRLNLIVPLYIPNSYNGFIPFENGMLTRDEQSRIHFIDSMSKDHLIPLPIHQTEHALMARPPEQFKNWDLLLYDQLNLYKVDLTAPDQIVTLEPLKIPNITKTKALQYGFLENHILITDGLYLDRTFQLDWSGKNRKMLNFPESIHFSAGNRAGRRDQPSAANLSAPLWCELPNHLLLFDSNTLSIWVYNEGQTDPERLPLVLENLEEAVRYNRNLRSRIKKDFADNSTPFNHFAAVKPLSSSHFAFALNLLEENFLIVYDLTRKQVVLTRIINRPIIDIYQDHLYIMGNDAEQDSKVIMAQPLNLPLGPSL